MGTDRLPNEWTGMGTDRLPNEWTGMGTDRLPNEWTGMGTDRLPNECELLYASSALLHMCKTLGTLILVRIGRPINRHSNVYKK